MLPNPPKTEVTLLFLQFLSASMQLPPCSKGLLPPTFFFRLTNSRFLPFFFGGLGSPLTHSFSSSVFPVSFPLPQNPYSRGVAQRGFLPRFSYLGHGECIRVVIYSEWSALALSGVFLGQFPLRGPVVYSSLFL